MANYWIPYLKEPSFIRPWLGKLLVNSEDNKNGPWKEPWSELIWGLKREKTDEIENKINRHRKTSGVSKMGLWRS